MSYTTTSRYRLVCNGCKKVFHRQLSTLRKMAAAASKEGWRFNFTGDWCPICWRKRMRRPR